VLSNDIYLGAIPWVIMQIILVVVVIFVPQSVTMFLDEKVVVDIDKVVIEMPTEEVVPNAELKMGEVAPAAGTEAGDKAAAKAAEEEQKKIDDLFKK
jgi:hypothetical protein